jgi:hypothetical protein
LLLPPQSWAAHAQTLSVTPLSVQVTFLLCNMLMSLENAIQAHDFHHYLYVRINFKLLPLPLPTSCSFSSPHISQPLFSLVQISYLILTPSLSPS